MKIEEDFKKEIKIFTDKMKESYKKDNLIDDFCTISKATESGEEFIQVGERTNLPKNFFEKEKGIHKDNSVLASDFIRSIVNGEKEFILKEIVNSSSKTSSMNKFNFSELAKIALSISDATHIFMPIEPFFMKIHHLASEGPLNFEFINGVGLVFRLEHREIKIDWIRSHQKIDKIIVLNKNKIKIEQKKFKEAKPPKGPIYEKGYEVLNSGEKVMIYFGEKNEKEFDFVFRTIISKPKLEDESVNVIKFKKDL